MAKIASRGVPAHNGHSPHKEKSELPLILFTLCAAASVGVAACACAAFVVDLVMQGGFAPTRSAYGLRAAVPVLQTNLVQPTLALAAFALATIGMLASIAHLAKPLRAPNALRNLASSWLSREILAVSAYWFACACWFGACFVSEALALGCCLAAFVFGVCVLVSAARAYRIHGQPLWDGPETNIELYAAACGVGVPLACFLAFLALSYTPMPLASMAEMAVPGEVAVSGEVAGLAEVAGAVDMAEASDALIFPISSYLMNDVLMLLLVAALLAAFVLYWLSGRMRKRRMAAIADPTPREQLAAARLSELEGPRELIFGLNALALLAGVLAALAWFAAGYVSINVVLLSTVIGFVAFFLARARFYRMSVISRHAARRKLR